MDYRMEELIPIVADLAKQYAGCDSTSITYENAQELMQGVIFCLDEYWNSEPNHLCIEPSISITSPKYLGFSCLGWASSIFN